MSNVQLGNPAGPSTAPQPRGPSKWSASSPAWPRTMGLSAAQGLFSCELGSRPPEAVTTRVQAQPVPHTHALSFPSAAAHSPPAAPSVSPSEPLGPTFPEGVLEGVTERHFEGVK